MTVAHAKKSSTRDRILEAASEVFAEYTFEKATVREICTRAGANVAAINYHFRDKKELYYLVLQEWENKTRARFPLGGGLEDGLTPEQCIENAAATLLRRIFFGTGADVDIEYKRLQVYMRELAAGKESGWGRAEDDDYCQMVSYLAPVVKEMLGTDDENVVTKCVDSVLGQIFHYFLGYVFEPDELVEYRNEEKIQELARHMRIFAVGGLNAVKETL